MLSTDWLLRVLQVLNHDSERDGTSLNYTFGSRYKLGSIFHLGWNYGVATILSSYRLNTTAAGTPNNDQGAPQDANGRTYPVNCSDAANLTFWRCDHREIYMRNMARFRQRTVGLPITNNVTGNVDQIGWGRGSVGYVAINNAFTNWTSTWNTGLPAGTYCNIISSANLTTPCANSITVSSNGSFTTSIGPLDAVALLR